jgi:hypothetical protein
MSGGLNRQVGLRRKSLIVITKRKEPDNCWEVSEVKLKD